ncbi:UvrB/UvrC motif-containing protein [Caulobacter segnis]
MSHLDELKEQLEEAVAAQDFETAAKLRVEIEASSTAPWCGRRRRPAPGLVLPAPGSRPDGAGHGPAGSQGAQRGWVPPKKPDPMTANHSRGGRGKV